MISRGLAALGVAVSIVACTHRDLIANAALYQQRFELMQAGHITSLYDPMEPIASSPHVVPIAALESSERTIAATALEKARVYAAANHSTALLVWRNGSIEASDYFQETVRTTPLNSLSLAKPLAVIAVGRALMLGKIRSLDESVSNYISEWRGTTKAAITVRELLQMRSGLLAQDISGDPASPLNTEFLDPYHDRVLINSYPLTDTPGSRYAYSNANADLVALLIERATGRRYAKFLSEEIIAPLNALGGEVWIDRPGGLAHSGCCVQLPAETWLRLGILVLQHGRWEGRQLLEGGFVAAMTTPTAQNPYAGMGVYVAGVYTPRRGFSGSGQPGPKVLHGEPYMASDLVLFDGNADQVVYIVPSAHLVALRTGAAPPKEPEWDNAFIPNALLGGIDWHGQPPTPQARE